jgi:hypothetical protein
MNIRELWMDVHGECVVGHLTDANRELLGARGVMRLAVETLNAHITDPNIVASVCLAIGSLVLNHPANTTRMSNEDIETVTTFLYVQCGEGKTTWTFDTNQMVLKAVGFMSECMPSVLAANIQLTAIKVDASPLNTAIGTQVTDQEFETMVMRGHDNFRDSNIDVHGGGWGKGLVFRATAQVVLNEMMHAPHHNAISLWFHDQAVVADVVAGSPTMLLQSHTSFDMCEHLGRLGVAAFRLHDKTSIIPSLATPAPSELVGKFFCILADVADKHQLGSDAVVGWLFQKSDDHQTVAGKTGLALCLISKNYSRVVPELTFPTLQIASDYVFLLEQAIAHGSFIMVLSAHLKLSLCYEHGTGVPFNLRNASYHAKLGQDPDALERLRSCSACGSTCHTTKFCSRCFTVRYCSRDCQTNHWHCSHGALCHPAL